MAISSQKDHDEKRSISPLKPEAIADTPNPSNSSQNRISDNGTKSVGGVASTTEGKNANNGEIYVNITSPLERQQQEDVNTGRISIVSGTGSPTAGAKALTTAPSPPPEGGLLSRLGEIAFQYAPLAVTAFGGPQAHIAMFHDRFVSKLGWLTDQRFTELMALGAAMPGPTSTQLATAIGAVRGGLLGAITALVTFQLPGALIMFFAGLGMRSAYSNNNGKAPGWLGEITVGVKPASVALIFLAAHKLGIKICGSDPLKLILAMISMFFAIWLPAKYASWGYPTILVVAGITSVLDARYFPNRTVAAGRGGAASGETDEALNFGKKRTGAIFIITWLVTLVLVISLRAGGVDDPYFLLFEAFFRVGSLIFGGGQVALPMLDSEVVATGWLPSSLFFDGLALVQALPGPMFNFSAYLGAAYLGAWGGLLGWAGIFAPGILLLLGVLPFWESVRKRKIIQQALPGINSGAIGLIAAAFVFMYPKVVHNNGEAAVLVVCGAMVCLFAVPAPLAIVLSGVLGWIMMRLDLGGPYCTVSNYIARNPEVAEYCKSALVYFKGV